MDTVRLLWRRELPPEVRPGRPPRLSVDDIVEAAAAVADAAGGTAFSLRDVARRVGVSVMSLYSYVDSKEQLLELMTDECRRIMRFTEQSGSWPERVRQVTADNLALLEAHPWLGEVESERAVLGPGTLAKYERELTAFDGLGLDDVDRDAALTLVLDFVSASARVIRTARRDRETETPQQWWAREGAVLQQLAVAEQFPLAARVGTAAGERHRGARDARQAHAFGLEVLLAGLATRVANTE